MSGECGNNPVCVFSKMSERELNEFVENVARRGAKKALAEIGLSEPEDRVSIRELVALFKDYKSAKAATKSWLWGVVKDSFRIARRAVAVGLFLWLLAKIGLPAERVEQLTKVFK